MLTGSERLVTREVSDRVVTHITDVKGMWYSVNQCINKVIQCSSMSFQCNSMFILDISMFYQCNSMFILDISMFYQCNSMLISLPGK